MADTNWLVSFMQNYDGLVDEKAKDKVLEGWEKVGEFSNEELSHWLKGVMQRLDAMVDEPTRKQLMERCGRGCAEMHNVVESAVERRKQFGSLDEYLEAEQHKPTTASRIEKDGQTLYVYYAPGDMGKRCFCSLWHGLQGDETVSLTWCNCSRSFLEKLWSGILERQAKVELLESCIAGAKECKFVVIF